MIAASVGFQCPECVREGKRSIRPVKTMYGGQLKGDHTAVTRALVAINVVIFIVTVGSGASVVSGSGSSSVYERFALVPARVAHGDWYRLFTSMFLHYGITHILFNMWALWIVGGALEPMLGRARYLALYFISGLGGSVLSFATGDVLAQAAGASGAIFGLFGAFFVILRHRNLQTGGVTALIVVNLVLSFTVPNIDWRGHVGGLIAGALVALVLAYAPQGPRRDTFQFLGVGVLALVLASSAAVGAAHVRHECPHIRTGATVTGVTIDYCSTS